MPAAPRDADTDWRGDSLEVISSWPDEVKATIGFDLREVQRGEQPVHCRFLTGIGSGVWELRDQNRATWYRVAYLPRKKDVVTVLHAFTKRNAKMPQKDKETILQRLKEVVREQKERRP